ncbi:MAG: sel1 repeat family protein [Alphaproteobacteria bacterium]|nr:sel1 repeat family protein [Alphaproteobacteria bacterium]
MAETSFRPVQIALVALAAAVVAIGLWGLSTLLVPPPPPPAQAVLAPSVPQPGVPEPAAPQPATPAPATQPSPPAAAQGGPSGGDFSVAPDGTRTAVDPGEEYYRLGLYPEALQLWRAEAEAGNPRAAYRLAVELYDAKPGVTARNLEEAVKWYSMAAEAGEPRAQFDLGTIYENGTGVPPSLETAAKWYKAAADRGHPQAQWNIATMLETGDGIAKDEVAALTYFMLAQSNGFTAPTVDDTGKLIPGALTAPEALRARLTPAQVAQATEAAEAFKPANGTP